MSEAKTYSYETRLNVLYKPLETVDVIPDGVSSQAKIQVP
jgi:hypothetical protein